MGSFRYFLLLPLPIIVGLGCLMHLKFRDQRFKDKSRQAYIITFPSVVDASRVKRWLETISGAIRGITDHMRGQPSLVFEVWADSRGITHRLKVPWQQADHIIPQLRSKVPGVHVVVEERPPPHEWTIIEELRQTQPSRMLNIPSVESLAESLLASMQPLEEGQAMLLQYVLSPVKREWLPSERDTTVHVVGTRSFTLGSQADKDEISDRRTKLNEPNFKGVVRIAAQADTKPAAGNLIYRLRAVLDSTRSPYNRFAKIKTFGFDRMEERTRRALSSVAMVPPVALSISELTGLLAWKLGDPNVVGLPQGRARQLPPTDAVPRGGDGNKVICVSNYPGVERGIAITPVDSCKHTYIVGRTGSGKSVLLTNLIEQDMRAGRGVVVIDPKGELFDRVLDRVPEERLNEVILMDVSDPQYPVGFNILQGSPSVAAADIQRLFEHLYPNDARGVRVRQGMYHAVMTLMTSKNATAPMTFADVIPLCTPRRDQVAFSENLIRGVAHDEELTAFWQELENVGLEQRGQYFGPLLNRVWQINGRRSLRNIIGQSKSGFCMRDVVRDRKILVVNLGRRTEGADTAGLVGSLLVNSLWSEIRAGGSTPDNPVSLVLDEFQDFLNLPIAPQEMLAQARSDGLAVTMAHQYFGQLKNTDLQDAVISNAVTKVVFGSGPDDARRFARVFGRSVDEDHLMNLSQWEVTCQVAIGGAVSSPMTGFTQDLSRPTGTAGRVRQLSRQHYARPVTEVEAEIKARRTTAGSETDAPPKPKPRRGGIRWE